MDNITRYVYSGVEAILTGRTAEKKLRSRTDKVYEIKPADPESGSWKKWVRMVEMHQIIVAGK